MIKRRLFAIEDAKTDYVLLLDDDVEFEPEFVEREFVAMQKARLNAALPKCTTMRVLIVRD